MPRNSTKLKTICIAFDASFSHDGDEWTMILTDKRSGRPHPFNHKGYTGVLEKGYSHLKRTTRS